MILPRDFPKTLRRCLFPGFTTAGPDTMTGDVYNKEAGSTRPEITDNYFPKGE